MREPGRAFRGGLQGTWEAAGDRRHSLAAAQPASLPHMPTDTTTKHATHARATQKHARAPPRTLAFSTSARAPTDFSRATACLVLVMDSAGVG